MASRAKRIRTVGAVCEAVNELGAGSEIETQLSYLQQPFGDFGACPQFIHSFTDCAYSDDVLRALFFTSCSPEESSFAAGWISA